LQTKVPAELDTLAGIPCAFKAATMAFTGRVDQYPTGPPATTGSWFGWLPALSAIR
jgi:hypothetical protein